MAHEGCQIFKNDDRVVGIRIGDEAEKEQKGIVWPATIADSDLISLPVRSPSNV